MTESTAILFAPIVDSPARLASLALECARVGAGAVRLPAADPLWLAAAGTAIAAVTDLVVLLPEAPPRELQLGPDPIAELARALHTIGARDLVVGGAQISALLAGLAAGTHLRAGSADTPGTHSARGEVQLVARAAALARLAGRPPMTTEELRTRWP